MHRILHEHLCNFNPISARQWGFLPKRSTSSALLCVMHDWLTQLDNGNEVYSVFFRHPKSFDSVSHELLLSKLAHIQLNPHIIQWIRCYLTSKTQMVAVGGAVVSPGGCMWVHLHPIHTPVHLLLCRCSSVCLPKLIKVLTRYMHVYSTVIAIVTSMLVHIHGIVPITLMILLSEL